MFSPICHECIGRLVAERPERERIFRAFGIDCERAGARHLDDIVFEKGINMETFVLELQLVDCSMYPTS
jgi:iron-sulfur cluster repair protein YtfE (RIC family)